jgi:hypothetical protein
MVDEGTTAAPAATTSAEFTIQLNTWIMVGVLVFVAIVTFVAFFHNRIRSKLRSKVKDADLIREFFVDGVNLADHPYPLKSTLKFPAPEMECEYQFFQHWTNMRAFKIVLACGLGVNLLYEWAVLVKAGAYINYTIRYGVLAPMTLYSMASATRKFFCRYETLADYIIATGTLVIGLALLVLNSIDRSRGSPTNTSTIIIIIMMFMTAVMFCTGLIWVKKATICTLCWGYMMADMWVSRSPDQKPPMVQSAFFLTCHLILVCCAGFGQERLGRLEFAKEWQMFDQTRSLQLRVENLKSQSAANGGKQQTRQSLCSFDIGNLPGLELLTPMDRVLTILTELQKANLDVGIGVGINAVTDLLKTTAIDKLNTVDVDSKVDPKDKQTSQWVASQFSTVGTIKEAVAEVGPDAIRGAIARKKTALQAAIRLTMGARKTSQLSGRDLLTKVGNPNKLPPSTTFISNYRGTLMSTIVSWDFDMFALADQSNGHPVYFVMMAVLERLDVLSNFNLPIDMLKRVAEKVEDTYSFDPAAPNKYHNNMHGADVLQTVACFLTQPEIAAHMTEPKDILAMILASMMHDYRHKGVNNKFLVDTSDELALVHNDMSVLERFHCAETFKLFAQEEYAMLGGVKKADATHIRRTMIEVILATDLAMGFEHISKFKLLSEHVANSKGQGDKPLVEPAVQTGTASHSLRRYSRPHMMIKPDAKTSDAVVDLELTAEQRLTLMRYIVKAADVSNPAKPLPTAVGWTYLICEEFFEQGEMERSRGMEVSAMNDSTQVDVPKMQRGFIDFVVTPTLKPLAEFCETNGDEWISQLKTNYGHWQILTQQGITDLSKSCEVTNLAVPMGLIPQGPMASLSEDKKRRRSVAEPAVAAVESSTDDAVDNPAATAKRPAVSQLAPSNSIGRPETLSKTGSQRQVIALPSLGDQSPRFADSRGSPDLRLESVKFPIWKPGEMPASPTAKTGQGKPAVSDL